MTAIVAGQGLGLTNTSLGLLGGQGQLGVAEQGRSGEKVAVNAATGNLIVQQQDEWLVGVGPDVGVVRTYNSLATGDGDNNDNWRLGFARKITASGTFSLPGHTVTRTAEDGSEATYVYDSGRGKYLNKDGGGSFDTLEWSGGQWTWTDGSTQVTETYATAAAANTYSLRTVKDLDGKTVSLTYKAATDLIYQIATSNGEVVEITYDTATGKTANIQSIATRSSTAGAQTLKRVSYLYDSVNRLQQVTVDLTPLDGGDAKTYWTKYTYIDATSRKLASLEQSDTSRLEFSYFTSGTWLGRINTITDVRGADRSRLTTITYDLTGGVATTTVKDALNQSTVLTYDASTYSHANPKAGQLLSVTGPAVGGVSQTTYKYDDSGNVASVKDARGNTTVYQYDGNGNRIYERDEQGNVVQRSYGNKGQLLSETAFTGLDATATGDATLASGGLTTRYYYDAQNHLRFVVTPQGRVTQHTYNSSGQLETTRQYTGTDATNLFTATDVVNWTQDFSADTTGLTATLPAGITRTGSGATGTLTLNPAALSAVGNPSAVYGTTAQALGTTWRAEFTTGSTISTNLLDLGIETGTFATSTYRRYAINVSANRINVVAYQGTAISGPIDMGPAATGVTYALEIVTQADGSCLLRVYESNKEPSSGFTDLRSFTGWSQATLMVKTSKAADTTAGSTIVLDNITAKVPPSYSDLESWVTTRQASALRTDYTYDFRGQLDKQTTFAKVDANGVGITSDDTHNVTQFFYDQAGNLLRKIDGRGNGTTYSYDGLNRIELQTDAMTPGNKTVTVYDDTNRQTTITLANNLVNISTYDQAGRLISVKRMDGSLDLGTTSYTYDKLGRLSMVTSPTAEKSFTLYDAASRKVGEIDAEGALTQFIYNASNQVVQTQRWAKKVSSSTLAALALDPSSGALPANLLSNDMAGWMRGVDGAATNFSSGINFDPPNWTLSGETTPWLRQVGVEAISSYLSSPAVNVSVGKTYEVSAYTGAIRAGVSLEVEFYGPSGKLSTVVLANNASEKQGGTTLAGYKRLWGLVTPPPGATTAKVIVRKEATKPGQTDSWLLMAHAYMGEAPSTQTAASPFDVRPVADAANDRTTRNIYDKANRLVKTIDGLGAVVEYRYDGAGRLSDTVSYATVLTPQQLIDIKGSTAELQASNGGKITITTATGTSTITVTADLVNDRRVRNFYSDDGLLLGTLDGANYYSANAYDSAGRLVKTTRYANAMGGTLADGNTAPLVVTTAQAGAVLQDVAVLPAVSKDQVTQYFYNNRGQLIGTLDAEGYYTGFDYDKSGNKSGQTRYATRLSDAVGSATPPVPVPSEVKTNNVLQSQSFATAPWATSQAGGGVKPVITAATGVLAPDGSTTATRIQFSRGTPVGDDYSLVTQLFTSQAAVTTNSIWVKSNTGADQTILLRGTGNWGSYREFTVGTQWTRIQVSGTGLQGFQMGLRKDVGLLDSSSADILVWGAQNEAGPSATDYIATTTTAVTASVKANYVLQSQSLTTSPWAPAVSGGGAVPVRTTSTAAAPDGAAAGVTRLQFTRTTTAGDDSAMVSQSFGATQTATTTNSIWVKSNTGVEQTIVLRGDGNWGTYKEFKVGLQWTRIQVSGSGLAGFALGLRKGSGTVNDLSADILVWGAQNESSGTSTDYIATTTLVKTVSRADDQKTLYTYDANNRLVRTQTQPAGLITTHEYDAVGNLTKTVKALGSVRDERIEQRRYDKLGRVVAELSGVGSQVIKDYLANPANATVSEADKTIAINGFWASYGTSHEYDAAGRRTLTVERNGWDATGYKTYFYYDKNGRLTHSINALGEVAQYDYNTFGEQTAQTLVGTRMVSTTGLTGGLNTTLGTKVSSLLLASKDTKTSQTYDQRGQVNAVTDALRAYSNGRSYNAFGELKAKTDRIDATSTGAIGYEYDRRGQRVTTKEFSLNSTTAIARQTKQAYDAFGRTISTTDGLSKVTTMAYDRLGRQVATTDRTSSVTRSTYDAFDRVLTLKDSLDNVTTYTYDTTNNKFTIVTPEQIKIVTELNLHGQTLKVTNGRSATTTRIYNADGQLIEEAGPQGSNKTSYDKAGRVYETTDPRGMVTRYTHDAANRLVTRTVSQGDLNLSTYYTYDPQGRTIWVKDANGIYTQTEYDLNGRVTAVVVDPKKNALWVSGADNNPDGLALRTEYKYDGMGQQVTVIEGALSAKSTTTQYTFDVLGRRTQEVVDATGALKLTTIYTYDANDNVVAKTDANGKVSRYVYDRENRLVYSVDPNGSVVRIQYDLEGRVSRTRAYAKPIVIGSLGLAITAEDITNSPLTLDDTADQVSVNVYDKDGRLSISVDALGYATKRVYDAAGNVTSVRRYAAKAGTVSIAKNSVDGALVSFSAPTLTANDTLDQVEQTSYDSANRPIWSVDALNGVTRRYFDGNGNVTQTTRYFSPMTGILTTNGTPTVAADTPDLSRDQTTYTVYDKANRATFVIDADNYVTQNKYDKLGQLTSSTRYASKLQRTYVAGTAPTVEATAPTSGTASYVLITTDDVTTQYAYDSAGRQTDVTQAFGSDDASQTHTVYDQVGRITDVTVAYNSATDASTTHYIYDGAGRVTEELRASGLPEQITTRYVLDALGQRLKVIDPRGVEAAEGTSSWALSTRQAIIGTTAAPNKTAAPGTSDALNYQKLLDAFTTTQEFDANGRITKTSSVQDLSAINGAKVEIKTEFDAFGNAVKVTDPNGNPGYFYFDKLNQATWSVDPMGYATQTEFDAFGQVSKITKYAAAASGTLSTSAKFAAYASATAATTAGATAYVLTSATSQDQVTSIEHDRLGHQTKITDAAGYAESMTYDALGNKVTFTNKLGGTYTYTYDKKGNVLTEKAPVQSGGQDVITRYAYDSRGNVITKTEAENLSEQRVTNYQYDKLDRQIEQTGDAMTIYTVVGGELNAQIPTETRLYDKRGNLIEVKAADGGRTLTYWDAHNRKVADISPTGTLSTYSYDQAGNLVSQKVYGDVLATLPAVAGSTPPSPVSASNVRETTFTYDANNRKLSTTVKGVTVGARDATTLAYSLSDTDIPTYQEYDSAGNVIKDKDANGNLTYSYYDKLGNKALQVDAGRYVTKWDYDASGNMVRQTRYGQALGASTTVLTSTAQSTLLAAIPQAATDKRVVEFGFDKMNRRTEERRLNVSWSTVDDNSGDLGSASGTVTTKYTFNGLGLVTQMLDAATKATDYGYDKQGRLVKTTSATFSDADGASVNTITETEYNGLGLAAREIQRGKNNAVETDDRITNFYYGKNGLRTSEKDALNNVTTFSYDRMGRVTRQQLSRNTVDSLDPEFATLNEVYNDQTTVKYDLAGRQIEQITSSKKSADTSYVEKQSQQTSYNAYNEVIGKGTNNGAQEKIEYDNAGRVWRTNSGTEKGAVKVYAYDANGNATLELTSSTDDLRSATVLADGKAASLETARNRTTVATKYNLFDALNKLTDSYEASMSATVGGTSTPYSGQSASTAQRTETIITPQNPFDAGSITAYGGTFAFDANGNIVSKIPLNTTNGLLYYHLRWGSVHPMWGATYFDSLWQFTYTPELSDPQNKKYYYQQSLLSHAYTADPASFSELYSIDRFGAKNIVAHPIASYYPAETSRMFWLPSASTSTMPSKVYFSGAGDATSLNFTYRIKDSGSEWSTISVPRSMSGSTSIPGEFIWDWSDLSPGEYEYRYEAFDGEVKKFGASGLMTLGDVPIVKTKIADVPTPVISYDHYLDWKPSLTTSIDALIHRQQIYNAYGEQTQEVRFKAPAAEGQSPTKLITDFTYNALGKLTKKEEPLVSTTGENGSKTTLRPTTQYYYDQVGRLVGTRDANDNLTTYSLLPGSLADQPIIVKEFHADRRRVETAPGSGIFIAKEGVKRNYYDVFGQLTRTANEMWNGEGAVTDSAIASKYVTSYTYDAKGQLTAINRPGEADENYEYDSVGQRIATKLAPDASSNRQRVRTYYDALGRVTKTTTAVSGRGTSYDYLWVASIAGGGGWRLTTLMADGRTLIDDTDYFGRQRWHKDLDNRAFTYHYNSAGLLSGQTSKTTDNKPTDITATLKFSNQDISFTYYGNGYLKSTIDNTRQTWTEYRYDDRGNRIFEGYARNFGSTTSPVWEYYQYSQATYDDANRLTRIWDPKSDINYEYDAVGNRRRVLSAYNDGAGGGLKTQDFWYTYDNMNRFIITMGSLNSTTGKVDRGSGESGRIINYNYLSQRTSSVGILGTESYTYDAEGYLEAVKLNGNPTPVSFRANDARGNVTRLEENGAAGTVVHEFVYDADNLLTKDTELVSGSVKSTTVQTLEASTGLLMSSIRTPSGGGVATKSDYLYEYWDSAKQSDISIKVLNDTKWQAGSAKITYDENGHAVRFNDRYDNKWYYYSTDADGRITRREEIDGQDAGPRQNIRIAAETTFQFENYYFFNGKQVGDVAYNTTDVAPRDYAQILAQGSQDATQRKAVSSADFDQNYQPIGPNYPGRTGSVYTVGADGESLQGIAQAVWGDASLWYLIADANGLTSSSQLKAGQTLLIPNKVTNVHNNTQTSRPYDPAQALGDISPTLPDPPPPPKKKGCGGIGMILMVVVAVVATVFTAGVATMGLTAAMNAGFGTIMAAGAGAMVGGTLSVVGAMAAGAAGSIASQLTGMATGNVEKFSWSGVAMGAIGGAVSAGIGPIGSGWVGAAMTAAAGNAVTQGVSMAVGLQKKFSWISVAAAGAGAAASSAFGGSTLGSSLKGIGGSDILFKTATGLVGGWASSLARHEKPNWGAIAAQSFGSALGDSIVGSIRQADAEKQQRDQTYGLASGDGKGRLKLGRSGGTGLQMTGNAAATFSSDVDGGIAAGALQLAEQEELDRQKWANWDKASGKVFAQEDAQAARDAQKAWVRQNANADVYRKQLAQQAAAQSVTWDGGAGSGRGFINPTLPQGSPNSYPSGWNMRDATAAQQLTEGRALEKTLADSPSATQWNGKSNDPYERVRTNFGAAIIGPQLAVAAATVGRSILATKAAIGGVLGYLGAAATGTESTSGRLGAGVVGATAFTLGGPASEMLMSTAGMTFTTSTMTVGGFSAALGEAAGQAGDNISMAKPINAPKIAAMGVTGLYVPMLSGEIAIGAMIRSTGVTGWKALPFESIGTLNSSLVSFAPGLLYDAAFNDGKVKGK